MILLDTCTLLWLVGEQERLSKTAKKTIEEEAGKLFVSAISAFKIGIKYHKKLLALPMPLPRWYEKVLELHGLSEIPITGAIAMKATSLPPIHKDPADRILIATALEQNLTLLTPDSHFRDYPDVQCVW